MLLKHRRLIASIFNHNTCNSWRHLARGSPLCVVRSPSASATHSTIASGHNEPPSNREPSAPVRVRFAPSPTGSLHLGGLRTALYNFLLARATGGQFLLRIEDTDASRLVPGAAKDIQEMLAWAGIQPDEGPEQGGPYGPYVQSDRLSRYTEAAAQLLESGHAYRCFCAPSSAPPTRKAAKERMNRTPASPSSSRPENDDPSLSTIAPTPPTISDGRYDGRCSHMSRSDSDARARAGEPHVVRMKIPSGTSSLFDLVHGNLTFNHTSLDDSVLLKRDGRPTYHLASVVDDGLMEITHVFRGDEWLPSTPKHLILHSALNQRPPLYGHLPLLLGRDRSKLSKRTSSTDSATSSVSPTSASTPPSTVRWYAEHGYLGPAVANWVALVGWTPPPELGEIADLNQLAQAFRIDGLHKSPGVVNFEKLDHVQKAHMVAWIEGRGGPEGPGSGRALLIRYIQEAVEGEVDKGNILDGTWSDEEGGKVLDIIKPKVTVRTQIPRYSRPFFFLPDWSAQEALSLRSKFLQPELESILSNTLTLLEPHSPDAFHTAAIKSAFEALPSLCGASYNRCMTVLRWAVSGSGTGVGVAEMVAGLGKARVAQRLQLGLEHVKVE
ncbi:glutamyl-tRNA synthetase [Gonapodya prolifera JEL478]|uniref:glutamate--tRNA ligase n=1 Tax=Gonapodya prolifera (strain JEL478) TaxID=1344416 RepID=A0A139AXL3_GONPJ|nr:glutamyl-tRNA synthetase [Gonapodya prolifera JEL478]|eukprot:KXS21313.1 glutamyl-tRNA synthetase [Gonapodya prolifera JEL478]